MPRSSEARKIGLARALSKLGHCSRSRAFEIIRDGQVRLNGRVCRLPEAPVFLGRDRIDVGGQPVTAASRLYLMMNKPRGIVTTASDEKGRATVYSLLPPELPWLGPVGRLDKASEGLLLLTNDSEWAAHITAPETHLEKIYHVQIRGGIGPEQLSVLQGGVRSGKEELRVVRASTLRSGEKNVWLEIVLDEGKNRHIRRMLEALDIEVLRLVRIAIGPLLLGDLKKGGLRELTGAEKRAMERALQGHQAAS